VVQDVDDVIPALSEVADADGPQLVLFDDAELYEDAAEEIAAILRRRRPDLHVVAAGRADVLRSAYGHWTVEVRRSRRGLCLRPDDLDADLWNATLPRHRPAHYGVGRGYLIADNGTELVQAARP
jgi:S-DNA-T family DNA segregation ATPase FtsK/SpoIIIE